ncbi:hypothetical protein [Nocardioides pocheonensis]|uniref:hypothetical protein n=1 Tax=Nocardioides pocheonensis TaxID=661485 RepID=UPI000F44986A|nr:hypothetical protein [Nocardioides pocheonensis]
MATAVAGTAATVTWSALAVLVSGRGLGAGNEGFYLLAYGRWHEDRRTFTGAQYLYGPLFDLLGHDIGGLRLLRLTSILVVHLVLGIAFARWLRAHRPWAPRGSSWEYAVASLVTASGAILYGWLPRTPGYNDVTVLGSELLVALMLVSLRAADRDRDVPLLVGAAIGFVAGAMVLAKPPSAVSLVVILIASAFTLHLAGARPLRLALPMVAGVVMFALAVQVLVDPWSQILPPLRQQISIVSGSTHSPLEVVTWYAESSLEVLAAALVLCAPTAIAVVIARFLPTTLPGRHATVGVVGVAASAALLASVGGFRSGAGNVLAFASGIAACVLLVLTSSAVRRLRKPVRVSSYAMVLVLLGIVPLLQGVGTNNALYATAVNGAGLWIALTIALVTARPWRATTASVIALGATTLGVTISVVVGVDGLVHEAGGAGLLTGAWAHVDGSSELASIALPASEADTYSRMRSDLGITPGSHRPMLAFGELAQYVLILGGRPIGEAWYSSYDDGLNAADLRAACRHGNPWGDQQPLVVANRDPSATELAAWRVCGVDFSTEYRDVTPPAAPDGVRVLRWAGDTAVRPDAAGSP